MSAPDFGSDPWLDAKLRNVPLPVGFVERLNQISSCTDEQLDAALRDVPLPTGFQRRLKRIPLLARRQARFRQFALAASVFLAVGITYAAVVISFINSSLPAIQADRSGASGKTKEIRGTVQPSLAKQDQNELVADGLGDTPVLGPDSEEPSNQLAGTEISDSPLLEVGPTAPGVEPFWSPAPNVSRGTIFGADGGLDNLPDLETIRPLKPRGVEPPKVPGYNLVEQLRTGFHPFVAPSAHKELQTSQVPLTVGRTSYELARRHVRSGYLPPPEEIRTEEFLAIIDYDFPLPTDAPVAIRTAAGTSPLGERGHRLLQVGVQAGELSPAERPGTYLTVAVDTSASMRSGGRLEMVRAALTQLVESLAPTDRFTLISFSDQAEMVIENAGRGNLEALRAAIESLQPEQATNVGAGLELACLAARRGPVDAALTRRLVLISDGLAELDRETSQQIEAMLSEAAAGGVTLQIVDLGSDDRSNEQMEKFAAAGRGQRVPAGNSEAIRYALLEVLTSRSQIVASRVSLKITFNPEAVGEYRLIGHEAASVTGPTAVETEIDLRAGQAATALYELWLKPTGGDDVAVAELTWQAPGDGQVHRTTQRISRVQFAKSFASAPLSLQAATIAAETAETLRGAATARGTRPLARIMELAAEVHPRLLERAQFREFQEFLDEADRARPASLNGYREP